MADAGAKKPGYDARQETVQLIIKRLDRFGEYVQDGELELAHRELRLFFNVVQAWMSEADIVKVDADLKRWRPNRRRSEDELLRINGDLTKSAKHLLLPSSIEDTYGEVDFNQGNFI